MRFSRLSSMLLAAPALAGCTGLFDIPDEPRLVSAPEESMPGSDGQPSPMDDSMPPPAGALVERPSDETTAMAPPLNAVGTAANAGRNIEDGRRDAGATLEAGAAAADASPLTPPVASGCTEPELLGPNGRCFVLTTTLLSWDDARDECRARGPGWDLASIPSDAVNQFMGELGAGEAWIGASDDDTEGLWVWVGDGTPFWRGDGLTGSAIGSAFENWNSDEPNGRNNSACARLVFTANAAPNPLPAWADLECFELLRSVCDGPAL
jgi:hypothetical protein